MRYAKKYHCPHGLGGNCWECQNGEAETEGMWCDVSNAYMAPAEDLEELAPHSAPLQVPASITPERLEELETAWNDSATWADEEYIDWFHDLTQDEQDVVAYWDERYTWAVSTMAAKILKLQAEHLEETAY